MGFGNLTYTKQSALSTYSVLPSDVPLFYLPGIPSVRPQPSSPFFGCVSIPMAMGEKSHPHPLSSHLTPLLFHSPLELILIFFHFISNFFSFLHFLHRISHPVHLSHLGGGFNPPLMSSRRHSSRLYSPPFNIENQYFSSLSFFPLFRSLFSLHPDPPPRPSPVFVSYMYWIRVWRGFEGGRRVGWGWDWMKWGW